MHIELGSMQRSFHDHLFLFMYFHNATVEGTDLIEAIRMIQSPPPPLFYLLYTLISINLNKQTIEPPADTATDT